MAWNSIPNNDNWEYSDTPETDKRAQDTYKYDVFSNHISGIRTNYDGTQIYVLCRQHDIRLTSGSNPPGYGELVLT